MSLRVSPDPLNTHYEECLRLHHCWLWFVVLGIGLIVVGGVAIGAAALVTLTTVLVFGWLLLAGGVVEIVNAFLGRSWRGFFLHLLGGILHLIVGALMIDRPERAAEVLTLMLAAAFLVAGTFRVVGALKERFAGAGWILVNGVIAFALGVAIWKHWPESSYRVIGLFVGIDLIFEGWSWVMLGLIVRATASVAAPPPPDHRHEAPSAAR
jgi:uncharacterized membrane protein HdeD (DUF308 family)